jgi:hypothetical protein
VEIAEEICARLEGDGISVWIAPRDVRPGRKYGEEILNAIEGTRATILVLSESANASLHVMHEIERAVSKGKSVFPVRVANVPPARALELFVASSQWIDLWGPGRAGKLDRLVHALREHLGQAPGEVSRRVSTYPAAAVQRARPQGGSPRSRASILVGAIVLALALGGGVLWQKGFFSSGPAIAVQVEGPAEAEVRVDGKLVGVARAGKTRQFAAAPGVHVVRVEAPGYWPYDKPVETVTGGEPVAVRLARKSSLVVSIEPPDATVFVNGRRVDRPFPVELPDGQHTVEVTAAGYESFRKTVTLAGGAQEHVNVALNKRSRASSAQAMTPAPPPTQWQQQATGADAFLRGLGEGVARGGVGGKAPPPPRGIPHR